MALRSHQLLCFVRYFEHGPTVAQDITVSKFILPSKCYLCPARARMPLTLPLCWNSASWSRDRGFRPLSHLSGGGMIREPSYHIDTVAGCLRISGKSPTGKRFAQCLSFRSCERIAARGQGRRNRLPHHGKHIQRAAGADCL